MDLPATLKAEIEQRCAQYGQSALVSAARELSRRYREESGRGKRLLTKDTEALAYAVVRMSATFGAVSSALEHTLACFPEGLETALDVGAGTGAAGWALHALLETPPELTCLEREPAMIALGSGLMAAEPALSAAKWVRHDLAQSPVTQKADLVMASYALNELDDRTRATVLENLWACTNKLLLLIEPGTPVGFAQLRQARRVLTSLGGQIVAPCPHSGECPLPAEDWCHFTCRISRSRLHKLMKEGDAPYEDEKFAYLAVSRIPCSPAPVRILRHPMKEAGHINLKLCTPEGIISRTVTKKEGSLFKTARKADAGDTFPEV